MGNHTRVVEDTILLAAQPSKMAWTSVIGQQLGEQFGSVVVGCGANSSRVAISSARYKDTNGVATGRVLVMDNFDVNSVNAMGSSRVITIDGDAAQRLLGYTLVNAGDIDGSGFDSLVMTAPGDVVSQFDGVAYIVREGVWGRHVNASARVGITAVSTKRKFVGAYYTKYVGSSIVGSRPRSHARRRAGGDINGDAYSDYVVGSFWLKPGLQDVYVLFGHVNVTQWQPVVATDMTPYDGTMKISNRVQGNATSLVGDINGDGADDLFIVCGVWGAAYVGIVFGNDVIVTPQTDIIYDGLSGVKLMLPRNTTAACATSADINNDGYDDAIVSSNNMVFVVFGHAMPWPSIIDLVAQDYAPGQPSGAVARVVFSIDASTPSVSSLGSAGDFDGDVMEDIIVGFEAATNVIGVRTGAACILYGNVPPAIMGVQFNISNRQTLILSTAMIQVVGSAHRITILVVRSTQGCFARAAMPSVAISNFTLQDVASGHIVFAPLGNNEVPIIVLAPYDGLERGGAYSASVAYTPLNYNNVSTLCYFDIVSIMGGFEVQLRAEVSQYFTLPITRILVGNATYNTTAGYVAIAVWLQDVPTEWVQRLVKAVLIHDSNVLAQAGPLMQKMIQIVITSAPRPAVPSSHSMSNQVAPLAPVGGGDIVLAVVLGSISGAILALTLASTGVFIVLMVRRGRHIQNAPADTLTTQQSIAPIYSQESHPPVYSMSSIDGIPFPSVQMSIFGGEFPDNNLLVDELAATTVLNVGPPLEEMQSPL
jgi:hypothetical protein